MALAKHQAVLASAHEAFARVASEPDARSQANALEELRRLLLAVVPELGVAPFLNSLLEEDAAPPWKSLLVQQLEAHLRTCRVLFSPVGSELRIAHHFLPPFASGERAGGCRAGAADPRLARLAYVHALASRAPPQWFEQRRASDPHFGPALLAAVVERSLHLVAACGDDDLGKSAALWSEWLAFADVFNLLVLQGWVQLADILAALRETNGGVLPLPHPRADGLLYLFAQALPLEVIKSQLLNDLRLSDASFTAALFATFRVPPPPDPPVPAEERVLSVGTWSLAIAVQRVQMLVSRTPAAGAGAVGAGAPPVGQTPGVQKVVAILKERHLWAMNYSIDAVRRLYNRMTQPAAAGQTPLPVDPAQLEPKDRDRIVIISHIMSQPVAQSLWNWAVSCAMDRARPRPFPASFIATLSVHCRFRLLSESIEPWLLAEASAPPPAAQSIPPGAVPVAMLDTYSRLLYTTSATISRTSRLSAAIRGLAGLRFPLQVIDLLTYRLFRLLRHQGTLGAAVSDVAQALQGPPFNGQHALFHAAESLCLLSSAVLEVPWPLPAAFPSAAPPAAAPPPPCPLGELLPRAFFAALSRVLRIASRSGAAGALSPSDPSPTTPPGAAESVAAIEAMFNGPRAVTNGWAFLACRAASTPEGPLRAWAARQSPLPRSGTVPYGRDRVIGMQRLRPLFAADGGGVAGMMGGIAGARPQAQDGTQLRQAFEKEPEVRRYALCLVLWWMVSNQRNLNFSGIKRAMAACSPQEIEACEFAMVDFVLDESSICVMPLSHALSTPQGPHGAALAQEGPGALSATNRASDNIVAETAGELAELVWHHGLLRFESVAAALAFRIHNSANAAALLEHLLVRSTYLDQRLAAWCGPAGPKRSHWEDDDGVVKLAQHNAQFPDPYFLHATPDQPPRPVGAAGAGAAAAPQFIAAAAAGINCPAGRGVLRVLHVAKLALAAALEAGIERLLATVADKYQALFAHADAPAAFVLQLLQCHRVDSPLLASPSAHASRFRLVGLLDAQSVPFTPAFRAHAAAAWDRAIAMQGSPPAPLPPAVHLPQLLASLVSNVPLVALSEAPGDVGTPLRGASQMDLFHEIPSHSGRAMVAALLEVLAGPSTPADVAHAALAAATGLPEPLAGAPAPTPAVANACGWLLASLPGAYAAGCLQAARAAAPALRPAFAALSCHPAGIAACAAGCASDCCGAAAAPQLLLTLCHALLHYTAASPPPPLPATLFPPPDAARLAALAGPALCPLVEALELPAHPSPAGLAWCLRLVAPFLPAQGPVPPEAPWARIAQQLRAAAPACLLASAPESVERLSWENFAHASALVGL